LIKKPRKGSAAARAMRCQADVPPSNCRTGAISISNAGPGLPGKMARLGGGARIPNVQVEHPMINLLPKNKPEPFQNGSYAPTQARQPRRVMKVSDRSDLQMDTGHARILSSTCQTLYGRTSIGVL
jgi:hypothetical protein